MTLHETLYRLSRTLHQHGMDPARLSQTLLAYAGELLSVRHGCLVLFDPQGTMTQAFVLALRPDGLPEGTPDTSVWERLLERGLIGFVRHGRRTVVLRDLATDTRWGHAAALATMPTSGSAAGVPLARNGHVDGVMMLLHPEVEYFDSARVTLLEEIAALGSWALGNALNVAALAEARAVSMPAVTPDSRHVSIFEDALVPIILTDLQGYILDVNARACELLGATEDNLLGLPITAVHNIGSEALGEDGLRRLHRGEEVELTTSAAVEGKGDVPMLLRARRRLFGNLDVIEWVEEDISAKMELEQLRRDLSAMVYHDLRGPLQTIKGSLTKLGQFLVNTDNAALLSVLQMGIRSARQLQRMVDSLLDIQRIEEGKAVLNRKQVFLRDLLTEAVQLVQPLAMDNEQRLKFTFPKDLIFVDVDNDMLIRVVTNLVENAIKYTPSGGTIEIATQMTPDGVRVSVLDTGPGIPVHLQRQVFDKFSRVKYKDAPKGVGLGLAFCRLAVEAHGGRIWVESEPGNGAAFVFTLPRESVQHTPAQADGGQALATA